MFQGLFKRWVKKTDSSTLESTDSTKLTAASSLPVIPPPKVGNKQLGFPGYVQFSAPTTAQFQKKDRSVANTDLLTFRAGADTQKVIRDLAAVSPDLSAAVFSMLRVALTEKYKCYARDMATGEINTDATQLAHQLLRQFDLIGSYDDGFSQVYSLRSIAESLGRELILYGACSGELVLDKSRLPKKIAPISVTQIKWYEDPKDLKSLAPKQVVGGEFIDLDYPTYIYVALDQDLLTAYSDSPLESSIQPVLADSDFTNDLRRVLKRSIHPRLDAILDEDKLKLMAPLEAQNDPEKMTAFLDSVRDTVKSVINGSAPEDAYVHFNSIELGYVDGANTDESKLYESIQGILNAKMAAGAKALPSILGHGAGTQNVASSETLLFMKNVNGAVRVKLNEFFSRILTLAVRLFGQDVAVTFEWDAIDLRPAGELEAFNTMHQSRILEQLSFGFITDEEASIALTGNLPGKDFKPLSGTQFSAGLARGGGENPYSGTSNGGAGGGASVQSRNPKTPQQSKS